MSFKNLSRIRKSMQLAGGSHAQRDVFERITIDAGLRSGQWAEVEAILNERRAFRGGSEDNYAAARRTLIANGRDTRNAASVPAE